MKGNKMNAKSWNRLAVCALTLAIGLGANAASAACGADAGACEIEGGTYHLILPEGDAGDRATLPALMFLHGWGGSGQGVLGMRDLVQTARDRGYAVIAPDGQPREGRTGRGWGFHPDRPSDRDEIAFLQAVRDDAAARHGIDAGRVLLAGFSIGGSMVSYHACAAPDTFAAYAPVSGAFWSSQPESCVGPVNLFHTHGWTDGVVPLEGRLLRGGSSTDEADIFEQADVWQAMQTWREANGCRANATGHGQTGIFWRREWRQCDSGRHLDFALFNGGHQVPNGWTAMALDWFEGV
ncbi:MAG: polyhydroxybutyrate depolymerase [Rhodobacteraceae bacterium CG17_big_fil_post_rev_8_21_14_2_50_65_11]|nr:MAG: polyhydroxybutyrate depolymerase [Rhodobacteraceae bacterium CG17_big_fil_post_rev_8_21_14_2_50_65_11]